MSEDGENGSNRYFFSRLAALCGSGLCAKAFPFVALGGAVIIAGEGIYRLRKLKRRREAEEARRREALRRKPKEIFEAEEGDA